jgi:hypothetical protein
LYINPWTSLDGKSTSSSFCCSPTEDEPSETPESPGPATTGKQYAAIASNDQLSPETTGANIFPGNTVKKPAKKPNHSVAVLYEPFVFVRVKRIHEKRLTDDDELSGPVFAPNRPTDAFTLGVNHFIYNLPKACQEIRIKKLNQS